MIPKVLLICVGAMWAVLLSMTDLSAQNREWEIDKIKKREEDKKRIIDSTFLHLNRRGEIKLNYGLLYLANHVKSDAPEDPPISGPMTTWQATGVWHFSERFFADISIGFQIKREVPTPDVRSAINGNDLELEGFGLILIPIDAGLKYYLAHNRFRPYIGLGGGINSAIWREILVEGNIANGINRSESQLNDRVIFAEASAGFDYRLGIRTSFTLNTSFFTSNQFKEPIGGYKSYGGVLIHAGLAIIL